MKTIEFRVRPVTRYNLTRYESEPETGSGAVITLGEFDHCAYANEIGAALQASEPGSSFAPFHPPGEQSLNANAGNANYIGSVSQSNGGKPYRMTATGWQEI